MSPSKPNHSQPFRKTTATISLLTFILTLTTLITTSLVRRTHPPEPPNSIPPQFNTPIPQTYHISAQYPADTFPLAASALATIYTLSLLVLTLLPTRKKPAFHLSAALFSTSFLALFLGIIYLSNSSALLPCTAGTTPTFHNPYVTRCQLRQTVFWSAVLGAVGFAVLAVVGGLGFVRARRARGEGFDMRTTTAAKDGDVDSVSVAPPSYAEKDGDVEAEGKWEERVRGAV